MKRKGRSPIGGLLLGGLFNIFGLAAIYFMKKRTSVVEIAPVGKSNYEKPSYSGSRFAQDSGKGALFHYASSSKGNELPGEFAIVDL